MGNLWWLHSLGGSNLKYEKGDLAPSSCGVAVLGIVLGRCHFHVSERGPYSFRCFHGWELVAESNRVQFILEFLQKQCHTMLKANEYPRALYIFFGLKSKIQAARESIIYKTHHSSTNFKYWILWNEAVNISKVWWFGYLYGLLQGDSIETMLSITDHLSNQLSHLYHAIKLK